MASPITTTEEVPEGTTPLLTATVKDETGTAIPGTSLTTMTMMLVERDSRMVINGHTATDLKPSVSALGVLSYRLAAADTDHVTAQTTEYHDAIIRWTYDTDGAGVAVVRMPIVDIPSI